MAARARELPSRSPPGSQPQNRLWAVPAAPDSPACTFPFRPHHAIHRHRADTLAETATRFQKRSATLDHAEKVLARIRELKVLDTNAAASAGGREIFRTEFAGLRAELVTFAPEAFVRPLLQRRNPADASGRSGHSAFHGVGARTLAAQVAETLDEFDLAAVDSAVKGLEELRAAEDAGQADLDAAVERFVVEAERAAPGAQAVTDPATALALTGEIRASILTESSAAMMAQANQASVTALRLLS